MTSHLFGPSCPWFDLHTRFPPNIDWCEEKLCSVIVTPFNSWTNLAYLLAAALMWTAARRSNVTSLRLFAPVTALTGLSSFAYHQSLNLWTQLLDFFGMYAFCVLILMANLQRMHKWTDDNAGLKRYWLAVAALTVLTGISFWLGIAAQMYVAVLIAMIIATELRLHAASRRLFWLSVLTMAIAAVLSALDLTRTVCDATNHWLQLHGLWHVLTALAIYFAFLHTRLAMRH